MKNARLPASASTSTTPTLALFTPVGGFSEIWFSTVGPVLAEVLDVLEVVLDFLPLEPPLSSTTATTTAATSTASTIAPPSLELRAGRTGAGPDGGAAPMAAALAAERSWSVCGSPAPPAPPAPGATGGMSGRLASASGASWEATALAHACAGSELESRVRVR